MADQTLISSGQLDRVVVLQRKRLPAARDALGSPVDVWDNLTTTYAQMLITGGDEGMRADEVAAQISATFVIRFTQFSPPLNPRDRLLFNPDANTPAADGLIYNIRRVTEVGRRVGHRIDAWTRADQL